MTTTAIARWDELADRDPAHAVVGNVDLVVIRYDDRVSVLYGRCLHRGALLADGHVDGSNLICGVHNWDYRFDTGISEYNNDEHLAKFTAWVEDGQVWVDADEISAWERDNPQPFRRDTYQGAFADIHGTVEDDIDAALRIGVDYVILDGRGGGTGAAPLLFRDNISVPTIPAIARARRHLDRLGRRNITLIATGGLRTPGDFAKAMALGADGVALANAAIQAIGCLGMRACHTNNCPVGIATQKPHLRERLVVEPAAQRLARFLASSVELMKVLARACGHHYLNQFCLDDLTTFDRDMASLAGVRYCGVMPP